MIIGTARSRAPMRTALPVREPLPALMIRGAGCTIGERAIFAGLDLELRAGERVHLAGANGAGKSTLLRCIAGSMRLTAGMVKIFGQPAGSSPARRMVGSCIEPERGLYCDLSGRENLLFAARLRYPGREARAAARGVEVELGISEFAGERVRSYSAGMRARVGIARALLGRPALLLLDEPTRSLDSAGQELLWSALRRRSVACLITSHQRFDELDCDRMMTLAGGR